MYLKLIVKKLPTLSGRLSLDFSKCRSGLVCFNLVLNWRPFHRLSNSRASIHPPSAATHRSLTLSVLSQLLERVVATQLVEYLRSYDLFAPLQTGFRVCHSIETAVLKVLHE
jgi:hypothetical protein